MKLHLVLVSVAALLLPVLPASATPSQSGSTSPFVLVASCAGMTNGGSFTAGANLEAEFTAGSYNCNSQLAASGGVSASASYASGQISNDAQGSVTYGTMHFAANNSAPSNSFFPSGKTTGGWADTWTISSPGLDGQAGRLVFTVDVTGTLHADGFAGSTRFQLLEYVNKQMVYRDAIFDAANPVIGVSTDRQQRVWALASDWSNLDATVDETVTFTVPFVYGQSFELGIFGFLTAGMRSASSITSISNANGDFSHTITWGGIQQVLSNGVPVEFTASTASGTNWAVPVPEPASAMLILAGVGALAMRRRR